MLNTHGKQSATFGQRIATLIAAMCISTLGITGISEVLCPPAHASAQVNTRTKIVRYHDLDLASDRGRSVLSRRISKAAKYVCADVGINAVINQKVNRACAKAAYSKAWSSVEQRMSSNELTDLRRN